MKRNIGPPSRHETAAPVFSRPWMCKFLFLMLSASVMHAGDEAGAKRPFPDSTHWIDPETQLMWTATDNGAGVSWSQAGRYCRDSHASGFKDWRLPAISELQRLFGGTEDAWGHHVRGPIKLTGWQWSSTPGERLGEGWALDFGDGARASVAAGDSGLNRALCVRSGH